MQKELGPNRRSYFGRVEFQIVRLCALLVSVIIVAAALDAMPPHNDSPASLFPTWRISADLRTALEIIHWLLEP